MNTRRMILGIDPGSKESAYCAWNGHDISASGKVLNELIIPLIYEVSPVQGIVAVEHLQCFGMPVGKETFETAYWIGQFRHECMQDGAKFVRVYRSEVKMHFCNSMRAKDANIRRALIDRFGPAGTKKNPGLTYGLKGDLWSAFAVAVLVYDKAVREPTANQNAL